MMRLLQAGPLTVGYENGFLRRVTDGDTEVLRMIYFALRDHNWNTIESRIENERVVVQTNSFSISYDCLNVHHGETIIRWKGMIEGKADGSILFEIKGAVERNFRKNRAGFCILHPLNVAGDECIIQHPDGSASTLKFPVAVAPDDPFKYIQSMRWRSSGHPYKLTFEGDVFETEDQRNWCDASYKTFCTPLDLPFPVELKTGDTIFQRVTFGPEERPVVPHVSKGRIDLRDHGVNSVLPLIGVGASTELRDLPGAATRLIKALSLKHYRVDLYPAEPNWVADFSHNCVNAFDLGLPLEAVLHLTDNFLEELDAFRVLCLQNRVKLRKILLLQHNALVTRQEIIDQAEHLRASFPRVAVGAGTNYNFNEINKNRFSAGKLDFISFAMDPQEHAFDDLTILENMEAQGHLVRSAKSMYGETMSVHVSPVTLRKRYNPYATNPADLFIPEELKGDPRQQHVFAAIWTFGSLCSLAGGRAAAVTYYQTVGRQGLVSQDGAPYPVYDVIRNFAPYQGKPVNLLVSSDPLAVQAVILDKKVLGLVNLTAQRKTVQFQDQAYELAPEDIQFAPLHRP